MTKTKTKARSTRSTPTTDPDTLAPEAGPDFEFRLAAGLPDSEAERAKSLPDAEFRAAAGDAKSR